MDQNPKSQDTGKQHSIWGWELKTKTNFEVLCASLFISVSRTKTRRRMTNNLAKANQWFTLETVFSSEGRQAQCNMQAKLHVEKSSQGEMLLAFKLLVYTHWCYFSNFLWHNNWTSPYANQFYKFDIPSFQFESASMSGYKTSSIKQHTIGLLDQTAKYESIFINHEEPPYKLSAWKH
jgi:hypothetical protein